jgi:hypothetical protein
MGGRVVSGILRRYAQQPKHTRGGFPDLTLWNTETKSLKVGRFATTFFKRRLHIELEKNFLKICVYNCAVNDIFCADI